MARQDRGMDRCDKVRVIYLPDNHRLTIINLKKTHSEKGRYQLLECLKPLLLINCV